MSSKDILPRVFEEAWRHGNFDVLDECVSADYIEHDAANPFTGLQGPDGLRKNAELYRAAFSDLHFTIDAQAQEGDVVTTRWTATGTHDGELMGIAATGRRVSVDGISMTVIKDGKMIEGWTCWDTYGLLRQLEMAAPANAPS